MRIVLSRLDRIGDLILSTPAIASIRSAFPQAHITIVCSRQNAVVMEHNPHVDACIVAAPDQDPAQIGRTLRPVDLAIALAPRVADMRLVAATRARKRIGYTYVRRYGVRLTARLLLTEVELSSADPELSERSEARAVRHEVDQLLRLAARAGAPALEHDLCLVLEPADREAVAAVPEGGIAVHIAPRWLERGSTLESLIELIEKLRAFGRPVVATYAAECRDAAAVVRGRAIADCVIGELPFGQWAAVFERSACVVTVDTGATHVASAVKRPAVVLFEDRYYRLSSQEWAPYRVPFVSIRKPPDESPESLRRTREQIVQAVGTLLESA